MSPARGQDGSITIVGDSGLVPSWLHCVCFRYPADTKITVPESPEYNAEISADHRPSASADCQLQSKTVRIFVEKSLHDLLQNSHLELFISRVIKTALLVFLQSGV